MMGSRGVTTVGYNRGAHNHPGCDAEKCPRCQGQLIACGCLDEGDDPPDWIEVLDDDDDDDWDDDDDDENYDDRYDDDDEE